MPSNSDLDFPGLSKLIRLGYHNSIEDFESYIELRASDEHISELAKDLLETLGYVVTNARNSSHHDFEGRKEGRTIYSKIFRDIQIEPLELNLVEPRNGLAPNESIIIFIFNATLSEEIDWNEKHSFRLILIEEFFELINGAISKLDIKPPNSSGSSKPAIDGYEQNRRQFRITPERFEYLYSLSNANIPLTTWRSDFVEDSQLQRSARIFLQVRRDTEIIAQDRDQVDVSDYDPNDVTPQTLYSAARKIAVTGRRMTESHTLKNTFNHISGFDENTVEDLENAGYTTVYKIRTASKSDISDVIGDKLAARIKSDIDSSETSKNNVRDEGDQSIEELKKYTHHNISKPIDISVVDKSEFLFYLADRAPVSRSKFAEECVSNNITSAIEDRFRTEITIDMFDYIKLSPDARRPVIKASEPYLASGQKLLQYGKSLAADEEFERAAECFGNAVSIFQLVVSCFDEVQYNSEKLDKLIDRAKKYHDLATKKETGQLISEHIENLKQHETKGDELAEHDVSKAINEYQIAKNELSEAIDSVREYNSGVRHSKTDLLPTDPLENKLDSIENKIESSQADFTVSNHLELAATTQTAVEELLEDGEFDRAVQRLEATAKSLAEAERLNSEHSLGRGDAITERQETINALLEEAAHKPEKGVREQVAVAEAEIERGVEARDADDIQTAVEAFETAVETYGAALTEATEYNLDLQWEIKQRASMATEYLATTQETLEERKQTVNDDLDQTLEAVESTVVRAEQQMEVGDTVSARESVDEAVADLDDAAKLIETDLATSALMERYGDLSERVASLSSNLPEETTGKHRDSDLIDTLQLITRKIGESPRPEFVDAYGEYPAEAYIESFGSWSEALAVANLDPIDADARERRQYSRKEALDALIELADELGHLPSRTEMNARGAMSSTTVANRFTDWDTALQFAEDVRSEPSVETGFDGDKKGTTPVDSGVETTSQTSDEDDEPPGEDDILSDIEEELDDW